MRWRRNYRFSHGATRQGKQEALRKRAIEKWKCVRDYAKHHKADICLFVNDDVFEFYFAKTPPETAELKEEHVHEVHKGLAVDRGENLEGG